MGFLLPPDRVWRACLRIADFAPRWHEDVWIVFPSLLIGITLHVVIYNLFVYAWCFKRNNVSLAKPLCGILLLSAFLVLLFNDVRSFLFVMWLPWFSSVWVSRGLSLFMGLPQPTCQ